MDCRDGSLRDARKLNCLCGTLKKRLAINSFCCFACTPDVRPLPVRGVWTSHPDLDFKSVLQLSTLFCPSLQSPNDKPLVATSQASGTGGPKALNLLESDYPFPFCSMTSHRTVRTVQDSVRDGMKQFELGHPI